MPKTSNSKSVTMVGGKNVAPDAPPSKKPSKADADEPESTKTPNTRTPKEPTE